MSIKLMSIAWDMPNLKQGEKLVLLKLADNANDDGLAWPSKTKMAKQCCMSKRAVDANLHKLIDLKLVHVEFSKGGTRFDTNKYYLNLSQNNIFRGADNARVQNIHPCRLEHEGVQNLQGRGAESAHEPSYNHQEPTTTSTASARTDEKSGRMPKIMIYPESLPGKKTARRRTEVSKQIAQDWQPGERVYIWAEKNGLTQKYVDSCIDEFVIYWSDTKETKKSWDSTFINNLKRNLIHEKSKPESSKQSNQTNEPRDYRQGITADGRF